MALQVGELFATLRLDDKQYRDTLGKTKKSAEQAGQESGRGFASKMQGSLRGLAGAAGIAGIGMTVGKTLMGGFTAALEGQTAEKTLSGLYQSGEKAKKMMDDLGNVSRSSPIDYGSYTKAAESLAYTGVQGQDAVETLENVGKAITAVGGSSEQLDMATNSLMRMVNEGKVSSRTLTQLSQSGVPVLSALADKFGVTIEQVNKMVTDGSIQMQDVLDVMRDGTGEVFQQMIGAGEEASKSFGNQWKILKDNAMEAIGNGLLPIIEALTPVMQATAKAAGVLGNGLSTVADVVGGLPSPLKAAAAAFTAVKVASMGMNTALGRRLATRVGAVGTSLAGMAASARTVPARMRAMQTSVQAAGGGLRGFGAIARNVGTNAFGGLRSAASGVMGLLGGPWGIAITGATVGLGMLFQKMGESKQQAREAAQRTEEYKKSVNDLGQALADTGDGYTEHARDTAKASLDSIKMADSARTLGEQLYKMGVSSNQAARGIAGVGTDAIRSREQIEAYIDTLDAQLEADREAIDQAHKYGQSGIDSAKALTKAKKQHDDEVAAARESLDTMDKVAEARRKAAEDLQASRDSIADALSEDFDVDASTAGIADITDAIGDMSDETKTATDRIGGLTDALDAMWEDQYTDEDATAAYGKALDGLTESLSSVEDGAIDASGNLDLMTQSGRDLRDSIGDYASAMNQAGATDLLDGKTIPEATAHLQGMRDEFIETAREAGLTADQAETLADHYGLIPEDIATQVRMDGIEPAEAALDTLDGHIQDVTGEKIITADVLDDEAVEKLRDLGLQVEKTPDGKHMEITAEDGQARTVLQLINHLVTSDNNKDVSVTIDGEDYSITALNTVKDLVNGDNEKDIVVDSNAEGVIALLQALNIKTTTLENGDVHVDDNTDTVRARLDSLDGKVTTSEHDVHVTTLLDRNTEWLRSQGATQFTFGGMADGGIRHRAVGALDEAQIRPGTGRGVVQSTGQGPVRWAEAETGWEAFIPGARSKRGRSLRILGEVARRMGRLLIPADDVVGMADGGITADPRDANARAIIEQGRLMGMSDAAIRSALAAGLVESDLQVLSNPAVPESANYPNAGQGFDHDSVGIFQQRQAGWGTLAERMDPHESARMFYDAYRDVAGDSMAPGAAAQAVQRSAFPDAYAQRMDEATALLDRLGASPSGEGTLTHTVRGGDGMLSMGEVSGDPVYVTNWPHGLGRSGLRAATTGEDSEASAPRAETVAAESGEDEPVVDVDTLPTSRELQQEVADALTGSVQKDLGIGGNGILSQLLNPDSSARREWDKTPKFTEQHVHFHVADVEAAMRAWEDKVRTGAMGFQKIGGR